MTICPCCGFKFHGALSSGCRQCGARAVGEPLPKPAHELPSYGRSLVLAASGSLVVLVFLVQTVVAFFQRFEELKFWTVIGAAETAAWQLKWVSIPLLLAIMFFGRKLYRSILRQPDKFCGLKYARRGLLASSIVVLLIALLIGVTVPERLRRRQMAREAAILAQWYTIESALVEYRIKYQTYPADFKELQERIPDPYGSLAEALNGLDPANDYRPMGEVAAVSTEKSRALRGAAISKASYSSAADDTTPPGGLVFTTYVLHLPGEDKIPGNEDDWIGRDGMIMKLSNAGKGGLGRSVSAGALQ